MSSHFNCFLISSLIITWDNRVSSLHSMKKKLAFSELSFECERKDQCAFYITSQKSPMPSCLPLLTKLLCELQDPVFFPPKSPTTFLLFNRLQLLASFFTLKHAKPFSFLLLLGQSAELTLLIYVCCLFFAPYP